MFSPGAFDPSIIKESEQIEIQPGHYTQDSGQFDVVHTEWENNEYNLYQILTLLFKHRPY